MATSFTSASCPTCETFFDRVPVEYDEDGGYVCLEVYPCAGCGTMLCACCDQFHCDGCGQTFCRGHRVSDDDLDLCTSCVAESKPICPACDEHADMIPHETSTERWYECALCHARMDEAEIAAAQPPEPEPTCLQCYELMTQATTCGEMLDLIKQHRATGCPHCALPAPRPAQPETRRAAAA